MAKAKVVGKILTVSETASPIKVLPLTVRSVKTPVLGVEAPMVVELMVPPVMVTPELEKVLAVKVWVTVIDPGTVVKTPVLPIVKAEAFVAPIETAPFAPAPAPASTVTLPEVPETEVPPVWITILPEFPDVALPEAMVRAPEAPAEATPVARVVIPVEVPVPEAIETAPDAAALFPERTLTRPVVPDVVVVPVTTLMAPEAAAVALPVKTLLTPVAVPESVVPVVRVEAPERPVPLPVPDVKTSAPPAPLVDAAAPPVMLIGPPAPVAPEPEAPPIRENAPPFAAPLPAAALTVNAAPAVSVLVLSLIWIVWAVSFLKRRLASRLTVSLAVAVVRVVPLLAQ